MKKIWRFLKTHLREDFDARLYSVIGVFLAVIISLNYAFGFEDDYLETMQGYPKLLAYIFFYSIPYYFSIYIYAAFSNKKEIFRRKDFWLKTSLAMFLLALDGSVPFLNDVLHRCVMPQVQFWAYKVTVNAVSFLTVLLPIVLFYFFYERKAQHGYGLTPQKFDVSPYFTMLFIMLPLLIGASFTESFQRQYPMYSRSMAHTYLNVPEWVTVITYEIAYGSDFITVEYLFRGFMVIGMISILGRGSVITMAVVYCVLHFGKPPGEAFSSIFGGYILGVVAYETKSIWGGIIVHIGIAWLMESLAFAQKSM